MDDKQFERISKALGDPYRIKIIRMVQKQDWMQCADIIETIDLTQSAISHHIKQLTDSGLLIAEKIGRSVKYTIDKDVLSAYINFLQSIGL
jgi:ArsR family transcriptional regulator, arsenate/arsenite/antimonite-responsive transcriptional repressor